jgi:hypothetical protein
MESVRNFYNGIMANSFWSSVVSGLFVIFVVWVFNLIIGIFDGRKLFDAFKSAFNIFKLWYGIKSVIKKFIKYIIRDAYLELEKEKYSNDSDLSKIFTTGIWRLVWVLQENGEEKRGEELFEIIEGNKYYKLDSDRQAPRYTFDIYIRHRDHDKSINNLCIVKVRAGTGKFHAEEFLKIYPPNRLEGVDGGGSTLYYEKFK